MKISPNTMNPVSKTAGPVREIATEEKGVTTLPLATSHDSTLTDAQQQLRQMPDVDMEYVQSVKAALQAGELSVDSATLSRAMMDYYRP